MLHALFGHAAASNGADRTEDEDVQEPGSARGGGLQATGDNFLARTSYVEELTGSSEVPAQFSALMTCREGTVLDDAEPLSAGSLSSEPAEILGAMRDVCQKLTALCEEDLLPAAPVLETADATATASTVGLMLHEVDGSIIVDNMVAGLPAFKSRKIDRGDVILQVDDQVSFSLHGPASKTQLRSDFC